MNADIHALSGAYAIDALEDTERAAFERHLTECAECREEVRGLRETAAMLGFAEVTPPPAMRDNLLAAIGQVRPLPPEVSSQSPAGEEADEDGRPGGLERHRARRRSRWLAPLAAAAAVAAIAAGVTAREPWADDTTQAPSMADQVMADPDATHQTVKLHGATMTLVRSQKMRHAVLVTKDMPAPQAGKIYQLWLETPQEEMVPAGVMRGDRNETVLLDGDAARAIAAGVTIEPEGGSQVPTSDPIALFDFSRGGASAPDASEGA